MKTSLLFAGLFVAGILLPEQVASQKDCRNGPCSLPAALSNGVNRGNIVTPEFFNGIMAKAGNNCPGKSFYARAMFITAIRDYQEFARFGSIDDSKRELAAFFAHVTHETGSFCYIEEIDRSNPHCEPSTQYPCAPNKRYYGRGPIQLTGNRNYGAAGASIGFDGVGNPERVAEDPLISFKTAVWFWMENVHSRFTSGNGFGDTIKAINSIECNGRNGDAVTSRVNLYTEYCRQFGVSTGGGDLRC